MHGSLRETHCYIICVIVIGTVVSVIFAILLHELGELLRGKFFQSALLSTLLLSWAVPRNCIRKYWEVQPVL